MKRSTSADEAPNAVESSFDRQAELVAKGVLFEKLERLPAGSAVSYTQSNEDLSRVDVRISVKTEGAQPTWLHGHALAEAAGQL